jgi:hypothetical protein
MFFVYGIMNVVMCVVKSIWVFFFSILIGLSGAALNSDRMIIKRDVYGGVIPYEHFFWRSGLNDAEKVLYNDIYHAAKSFEHRVPVNADVCITRTVDVLEAVRYDHPELFWLSGTMTTYYTEASGVIAIDLIFLCDLSEIEIHIEAFDTASGVILDIAKDLSTDFDKIKFIHDTLIENNLYGWNDFNQSAYSAVVLGEAVCMGYASAFNFYMQKLGIPSALIKGAGNEELHVWNIVKLDGEFYNIDVTWNDMAGDLPGAGIYTYFLLSDEQMSRYHIRDGASGNLPAALNSRAFDTDYTETHGLPLDK